jgi:hypothetical protein
VTRQRFCAFSAFVGLSARRLPGIAILCAMASPALPREALAFAFIGEFLGDRPLF